MPASSRVRFCSACGTALAPLPGQPPPAPRAPAVGDGSLRQLAAMFCDLVGSTPLSQSMDLEEYGDAMLDFQSLVTRTVTELGGSIATYAGDGMSAYFGWPVAHEDDAIRAVQAGLTVLERLAARNARPDAVVLSARVGVHVGPVVLRAGRDGRADTAAFGETLNVASRLESAAEPGTVLVSADVRRLVAGAYRTAGAGSREFKGVERPVETYRVEASEEAPARTVPALGAPLVGRESELAVLRAAWADARAGVGHTVVLIGEPRVGKSRLLAALGDAVAADSHRWLELRCSPLTTNTAFHPVAGLVRRTLGLGPGDAAEDQWARVRGSTAGEEDAALLGRLLGLAGGASDTLTAEQLRRALMETLRTWVFDAARDRPVVLACEDLHWADPSTLELVRLLDAWAVTAPLLIVLTRRPEGELGLAPGWDGRQVVLERLEPDAARELARHLVAARGLAPETADRVAARADGVPLFLEELVAATAESPGGDLPAEALPASLQSSLLARLDRLGPSRAVAQVAAVLGRSFPAELLEAVVGRDPSALATALAALREAGLLQSTDGPDGERHEFRHALIRDAAYVSLLRRDRTALHRRVAVAIEAGFPAVAEREPELLGHHLAAGGDAVRAAECFERAGRRAAGSAALAEAVAHYRRGAELLGPLPPARERDRREMWLEILHANALMGSAGLGSEAILPVWERAVALAERVGDPEELTAAVNGLAMYHCDVGELDAAVALAERQVAIGEREGSRFARLRGHGTLGLARWYRGEGEVALGHLRASLAEYRPGDFATVTFGVGHDQGIFARSVAAWAEWWLGRPDRALAEAEAAVAEAQRLGSFLSLAMARQFAATVHELRSELETARGLAEANLGFARELGFAFWEQLALLQVGSLRVQTGDRAGLELVGQAVTGLAEAGSRSGVSSGLASVVAAHRAAGDPATALVVARGTLGLARELGQPFYDAELLRLEGELILEVGGPVAEAEAEAEARLRDAVALARSQGAASFGLRAAISLARLRPGDPSARAGLAEALAAMGDGAETADSRTAVALLATHHPEESR